MFSRAKNPGARKRIVLTGFALLTAKTGRQGSAALMFPETPGGTACQRTRRLESFPETTGAARPKREAVQGLRDVCEAPRRGRGGPLVPSASPSTAVALASLPVLS